MDVVVDTLRSLPVEQRMEAMGMRPGGNVSHDGERVRWQKTWVEADA